MTDLEKIDAIINAFDAGRAALTKYAFTPMAPPAPPATAQDPNAMPPGGAPPMDPNAMPPGAMPPPPGDPSAMPPGAMPPGDPNAVPPPPADPNAMPPGGSGISPELESAISQLAGGMTSVSQTVEAQQAQTDQLSQRMLAMEEELNKMKTELKAPAPFEG